jgi:anti-sigma factor ChrR (cupin superfamily)
MDGVERRMLERDGEELARATSIVRYARGARFTTHVHDLGEEIYVLEGEFCDEHGRYPAGTWIKNPPGSHHSPWSEDGCTLFVKLRHLQLEDSERAVVNSHAGAWTPGRAPQVDMLALGQVGISQTGLVRFAPGARSTHHVHIGGEELYVLQGGFEDEWGSYRQGTWIRNPHGSSHLPFSRQGCLLFAKVGHLPQAPANEAATHEPKA